MRELLDRRARAIRERDEVGFTATLDPGTDPGFRLAQGRLFTNLAGVQLDQWDYPVDATEEVRPSAERAAAIDADELWAPLTRLRYALTGVDPAPTSRPMGYLYARRGDQWYLSSDTALERLGRSTWRGPWDFGPCVVAGAANGRVVGHPGAEQLLAALANELDPTVQAVTATWGSQWSQRLAVLVPDSPAERAALTGEAAPGRQAAIAVADHVDRSAATASGQRIIVERAAAERIGMVAMRVVLRHEATHVATRAVTDDAAPLWLVEGFAEHVGYLGSGLPPARVAPGLAAEVRAGRLPGLPADAAFRGAELELAYQRAWSVVSYLDGRLGGPGLVALYRSIVARPADATLIDAELRAAVGLDRAGLVGAWHTELRRTLAG